MDAKFKVGDRVRWTSQSGGFSRDKQGVVVQIVHARELPNPGRLRVLGTGFGNSRKETSYLIEVNGVAYWPRVNALELIQ